MVHGECEMIQLVSSLVSAMMSGVSRPVFLASFILFTLCHLDLRSRQQLYYKK